MILVWLYDFKRAPWREKKLYSAAIRVDKEHMQVA